MFDPLIFPYSAILPPPSAIMTADGSGKVTDKMAHTDNSVDVCAMSVVTLKITPTILNGLSRTDSHEMQRKLSQLPKNYIEICS